MVPCLQMQAVEVVHVVWYVSLAGQAISEDNGGVTDVSPHWQSAEVV